MYIENKTSHYLWCSLWPGNKLTITECGPEGVEHWELMNRYEPLPWKGNVTEDERAVTGFILAPGPTLGEELAKERETKYLGILHGKNRL